MGVGPDELIESQHDDGELAPYFAHVGEGSEEVGGSECFVLKRGILCRKWREEDGGELCQVVVPSPLRKALILLAHEGDEMKAGEGERDRKRPEGRANSRFVFV